MDTLLKCFFTLVYFWLLGHGVALLFRQTHHIVTDLLTLVCWIIAFLASVGLAEYTVKKIRDRYSRK